MEKDEGTSPLNKLFNSIDNLLSDEKEEKLRSKLGKEIRKCIFTEDIIEKLMKMIFQVWWRKRRKLQCFFL